MASKKEDAYCTLLMSDSYLPGATVLANSLRDAGTAKKLVALITHDTLSLETITKLRGLYDELIAVPRLTNPNPANLFSMNRYDLIFTFTKIAVWKQTKFRKIVYLDADVVVLRAPDELFNIDASFAAAPDVGWPDAFNTGVMVIRPDEGEYRALSHMAASGDSFDGADQGLLNQYFEHRPWQRMSFTYNCTPNAQYQWEPAYRYHKSKISMVHFIGRDKPWTKPRPGPDGPGVYNELLGRWWAVHDRHLEEPAPPPPPTQPSSQPTVTEQQRDEVDTTGTAAEPLSAAPTTEQAEPEAHDTAMEQPPTESDDQTASADDKVLEPTPTEEQPTSSPPHRAWDATRDAPPEESQPEAANFPSQTYEFSGDKHLFQPPRDYPEPPKDMWYEVPEIKPTPYAEPKKIFPWELRERPKPTRVFAEDLNLPPPPAPEPVGEESELSQSPTLSPAPVSTFAATPNTWDNNEGIERYVRAVIDVQTRRPSKQHRRIIPAATSQSGITEELSSPTGSKTSPSETRQKRRESLILTDFPTADDRPSLPVTPAPIRRLSFWGAERDEAGELPAAVGVPNQADWDPAQKLEELRRSSLLEFEHLKLPSILKKDPPLRELPEHSIPTPPTEPEQQQDKLIKGTKSQDTLTHNSASPQSQKTSQDQPSNPTEGAVVTDEATTKGAPMFREPEFAHSAGSFSAENARESLVSPTER